MTSNNNIESEYDMVDDEVENARRQIEEDQVFERKFAEKKKENSGKEKSIIRSMFDYLFDSNRRVPPILRILGAFFDPKHLAALALEEVEYRVTNPKSSNVEDDLKILLEMIPEIELKEAEKLPDGQKDCIFCCESFVNGDIITILPCLHIFHSNCLKDWFKEKSICPVCRNEITKENFK